jgi:small subunit ribosomal protein S33
MPAKFPCPPPSFWRLNTLFTERAQLFKHTSNPEALRLGNKILKMRMRAQAIEQYYPQEFKFTPRILGRMFPGLTFQDEEREQWEEDVEEYLH